MASWAPGLHSFALNTLADVERSGSHLNLPFKRHPFSALTFNIGPEACTIPHIDSMDLPWSWCAVTSLGDYNYELGGHLVLWDLGVAIQFPPFSTIFLPSAILLHSNVSIGPNEHRSSVTQYNSAGLFRWVAYDYSLMEGRTKSGKPWWDDATHMFRHTGARAPT